MHTESTATHRLPDLPYGFASLEPHIDAPTMMVHHDEHHATYVGNLNTALEGHPDLHAFDAAWLLMNTGSLPRRIRTTVRNNAGGHVNHSMFWRAMSPATNGLKPGPLATAIDQEFGSLERFKTRFASAGMSVFGCGWVWLVKTRENGGRLRICTTHGHGNPMTQGFIPILLNDVWEHAYYLKHVNRRADYLKNWWPVVNWEEAELKFAQSDPEGDV